MASVWVVSGCVTEYVGRLALVSTREFDLERLDRPAIRAGHKVTGRTFRPVIFVFPLGLPRLEDAVDDALEKGGGDVLIGATAREHLVWWVVGGKFEITVKGTVVNTREAAQ